MSNPVLRSLLLIAVVVLVVIICRPPATLPIYRLAPPVVTVAHPGQAGPFVPAGATVSETADRLYFRSGNVRLEVYKASGGFWMEDTTQLWNPEIVPQLRDSSQLNPVRRGMSSHSRGASTGFAKDSAFTSFEFTGIRPTLATIRNRGGGTSTVKLDWRVGYAARVADRRPWARKFPVTGGGGEFKINYGDQGAVIGFHGVWREIRGVARRERVIPRSVADQQYLTMVARNHPVVFQPPYIAYYSVPAPFAQDRLYPVYVYSGRVIAGGDTVSLRAVTIPATRGQGQPGEPEPGPVRAEADAPRLGSRDPEGPEEGGSPPPARTPWLEVAASWLGSMDGVPNGRENATGLLDTLRVEGWAVNFEWADANAWHQDWKDDRARWADAADLLFYTGHASLGGWKLYDHKYGAADIPRYKALSYRDSVVYGAQDLEWIVISACGPLQDDLLCEDGGSALDRWSGIFGGLHLLLGYGSDSRDYPGEGKLFARYALEGKTIVNAWLRAAAETQPSEITTSSKPNGPTVWAGAMWARKIGKRSPYLDHLWGHGDVAEDPKDPDEWGIIWSPT
jgi:hypothetical protein